MERPTEVLLVGHDASDTGAPGMALRWSQWAAGSGSVDLAVWLQRGGPLQHRFEGVGPTRVGGRWSERAAPLIRSHAPLPALARAGESFTRPRHQLAGHPIVVANTVAAWTAAASVRRRSRLVVWIHELDHVCERILTRPERTRLLGETDHLIATGDRVAAMLRDRWQVPPSMVTVVDSSIDAPLPDRSPPSGHHDVIAVGSLTARKGPDAFVAVVSELRTLHPTLAAAWIGGPADGSVARLVRHDIEAADLGGHLDLVGEVPDVRAWLPPDGILLHTAREDPAPVAVLEAASEAIAVVTWDTGGAADLLRQAGLDDLVAPAGDALGLVERVHGLLADPAGRRAAGSALQAAAAWRTTERLAPVVHAAIVGATP
ncbi:glycosyltransferase family 4 protein [Aquihabitans sp. McL0605]|uniref:glycosyltransferase family 4 protein n=1 Tax=Aquihabitans sp. McL0605 TaxID=3415671 RepID=UPI003CF66ED5